MLSVRDDDEVLSSPRVLLLSERLVLDEPEDPDEPEADWSRPLWLF